MFAVTERLLLRPGWAEDALALTRAIANQKIAHNLALLPWPYVQSDAEWFLSNMRPQGAWHFLITTRHNAEIIGGIGLQPDPEGSGLPELGYWISEAQWGKGYATEAGKAVVELARHTLKHDELRSAYFTDNPASGAVLRKLGFKPIGRIVARRSAGRNRDVPTVLVSQDFREPENLPGPVSQTRQMQMMLAA